MITFGLLGPIGWPELIIILVIVLLIVGPGKLPQLGKALGDTIKQFKKSSQKDENEKSIKQDQ